MVTLAPSANAFANMKSSVSAAGSAGDRVDTGAVNAALCMAGDTECDTGRPTRP
jgi:hypothetical protein